MKLLSVAREFSETPGPRYKEEGAFSGVTFRTDHLTPAYIVARDNRENLLVDLDGTDGFATSFLEEAFGGLVRAFPAEDVASVLKFKCEDEPFLEEEVRRYMKEAAEENS